MFLNYMQQNRSIVQKLGHPVEEKIYKGYIEKTQKNRKIALNYVQFTHFRKISVKKIDSTSCGSLMAKNIGQDLQLQPKKAKSGLFSAFRGLDFKEFPLSDQNSKKLHIYVLKRFYCSFSSSSFVYIGSIPKWADSGQNSSFALGSNRPWF